MSNNRQRIFWFATVSDNNDPLLLNRVRVKFDTENNQAILDAIPNTKDGKNTKTADKTDLLPEFKWSNIDSFCCLPLLPYFIKATPKINETVNIFFPNTDHKYDEQYYIPGVFSSPLTSYRENFNAQRMFAAKNRLKDPKLLKNPTNNEYYITDTKGVFIEPDDIGINSRGTSDLVLKERDLLLRAGKSTTLPQNSNKEIIANPNRSFIQLSDFIQKEQLEDPKTYQRLEENISYVKTLVEWHIINPENQHDVFNYTVNVYRLPEKTEYTTKNMQIDSNVQLSDKAQIFNATIYGASMADMTSTINNLISQCNNGQINVPNFPITNLTNQFPLYYRPSHETYSFVESPDTTTQTYQNISNTLSKINFKNLKDGFGLIGSKDKTGQQFSLVKDVQSQKSINPDVPTTYNVQGANKIVILSHDSKIPSKKQITLDKTTIYGIEQSYLAEQIIPNTDPMVRGDELMKFMNTVIKFLISHVHSFPGLPPIPTATDGTTISDILQQLQNASQTILNQNIRIN